MKEAMKSKHILGAAAIALFALAFIPATAFAASSSVTSMSLTMSGIVVNPSQGQLGTFSMNLNSNGTYWTKGALVQGFAFGQYNGIPIGGGWSYNSATGKALMKVISLDSTNPFSLNLAFITSGAPAGFTFQGTMFVNGERPVMLSAYYPGGVSLTFS